MELDTAEDSGSEGGSNQKFWAFVVKPGGDVPINTLLDMVLTRAVLAADSTSTERSVLQVKSAGETVTLAHLVLNRKEQTNLNLVFSAEEEVVFSVVGKNDIHISGYYELPDISDDDELEMEEDDEDEEVPVAAPKEAQATSQKKRALSDTPAPAEKKPKTQEQSPAAAKSKTEATPKKKSEATPKKTEATPKKETKTPEKEGGNVTKMPNGLIIEEIKLGEGSLAKAGKQVGVKYAGFLTNGKKFDSSLSAPFNFKFGTGEVIKGWDLGLTGMRVGGKRKLTIPAKLGYGAAGAPPDIPGNSTLIFNVELCTAKQ